MMINDDKCIRAKRSTPALHQASKTTQGSRGVMFVPSEWIMIRDKTGILLLAKRVETCKTENRKGTDSFGPIQKSSTVSHWAQVIADATS